MKKLFITLFTTAIPFFMFASFALAQPKCDPLAELWDHCIGSHTYDDGSKYSGEWQANKRHGEGIYIYATGNKYKGQFKADKRHGLGTFTWTDGESYVGYWRYDTPNGQGTRNFSNGSVKSGIWKDGKFQPSKKFNPSVFALSPKQSAKEISAS